MIQLTVRNLHAHYGKSHVLHGVDLDLHKGSITSILGRNGSGRSTTLKAVMGIVGASDGSIGFEGTELAGLQPNVIAKRGIAYVPEDRQVFANLSVTENLVVGSQPRRADAPVWIKEDMFNYFPRLRERQNQRAGTMSGGEQQMLTLCRSLMGNPKVILIDEPTEGLAPQIVSILSDALVDIARRGVTVLLVEQKLALALRISEHVLVMGHGQIAFSGTIDEFKGREDVRRAWLDVAH